MSQAISSYFKQFTKDSCEEEMCVALARIIANSLFVVFEENKNFESFQLTPILNNENKSLVWGNPVLKVKDEDILILSDENWNEKVKRWSCYKDNSNEARENILNSIQLIVEKTKSYFSHYPPFNDVSSFRVNSWGYFFKVGQKEERIVSFSKI